MIWREREGERENGKKFVRDENGNEMHDWRKKKIVAKSIVSQMQKRKLNETCSVCGVH